MFVFCSYLPPSSLICPYCYCCHQNLSIFSTIYSNPSSLFISVLLGVYSHLLVGSCQICHHIIQRAASPRTVDVTESTRSHYIPISLLCCCWRCFECVAYPLKYSLEVLQDGFMSKVFHFICCGAGDFARLALRILFEWCERALFASRGILLKYASNWR